MADAREKLAFRLVGALDFFHALAFGDIFDRAFVIEDRAVCIADAARILADPNLAAIFAIDLVLEQFDIALRIDQSLEFVAPFRIDIHHLSDVSHIPHQFFRGVEAMNAGERRIDAEKFPLGSRLKHSFDRVLKHVAIFLLGLAQGFFGAFALGDVVHRSEHPPRLTGLVQNDVALAVNKVDVAIGPDRAVLEVVTRPARERVLDRLPYSLSIFRVQQLLKT